MKNRLGILIFLFFFLVSCSANLTPTVESVASAPPVETTSISLGRCSISKSKMVKPPPFDPYIFEFFSSDERNSFILNYLNQYGIDAQVLENQTQNFVVADLTNDNSPEFIYFTNVNPTILVFGCRNKEYQILFESAAYGYRGYLEFIKDLNQNGFPEVAFNLGYLSQGGHFYEIVEWDGSQFQDIFPDQDREINATGTLTYADVDKDEIQELIVNSGIYSWGDLAWNFGPWRNAVSSYEWDGTKYVLSQERWDPPEYRFQAVQDADRLFLAGKYDDALVLYQQAITNPDLEWWSQEIRDYENAERQAAENPATLPAPPSENPNEYIALSAYSYFRMTQIYIIQNQPAEAEEIYQVIQSQYGNNSYGKSYAKMATVFWDEYTESHDIISACQSAIGYAETHQNEILPYLGTSSWDLPLSADHGIQSLEYTPESVCPVK